MNAFEQKHACYLGPAFINGNSQSSCPSIYQSLCLSIGMTLYSIWNKKSHCSAVKQKIVENEIKPTNQRFFLFFNSLVLVMNMKMAPNGEVRNDAIRQQRAPQQHRDGPCVRDDSNLSAMCIPCRSTGIWTFRLHRSVLFRLAPI